MKQVYSEKNQDDDSMMGVGGINWEEALQIVPGRWTCFIGLAKNFIRLFWNMGWKTQTNFLANLIYYNKKVGLMEFRTC